MQRTCANCGSSFEITNDDLKFYEKISPVFAGKKELIPPPTRCPDCRTQQRFTWRNDRKLYHRKCDLTGKEIISIYAPDKPYKVYEQSEWWSDKWDAMDFGRDMDFRRPFFEQFSALLHDVPIPSRHVEQSENSEYGNFNWGVKNCYLVFASDQCQDCIYCDMLFDCSGCMDCSFCKECQYCYQLLDSEKCYRCFYSQELTSCETVDFSIDCKSCRNCFGCTGLRGKEYHLFNEPLNKPDYEAKLAELTFTQSSIAHARDRAVALWKKHPHVFAHLLQCENCTGDNLLQCKNCRACFDGKQGQDCAYAQNIPSNTKDCHDVYGAGYGAELDYQGFSVAGQRTLFSFLIYPSGTDVLYSAFCGNCKNIFGCIGLKRQQYCIFNKQYTKEEYQELVPRIIEHMKQTKEYGEFFPSNLSPFTYNESLANDYFPLTKKEALKQGYEWSDEMDEIPKAQKVISAEKLPESIEAIPDDVLNWAIQCKRTKRPFRIIRQELMLYRQMKLPIPHLHPNERYKQRMTLRNPHKLWHRQCDKCGEDIQTTYAPERPEIVYCEKCYLAAVY